MPFSWPQSVDDLPATLPIFPLGEAIVLPRATLPLNIFEPRYLAMVDDALASHRMIGMIQPRSEDRESPASGLYRIGGAGRITSMEETGDGRYLIVLTGLARFRIVEELDVMTAYRQAKVDWGPFAADLREQEAPGIERDRLLKCLDSYLRRNHLDADWDAIEAAPDEPLVNALAMMAPVDVAEKQALLEADDCKSRADILVALIEMALADDSGAPIGPGQGTPIH